MKQMINIIACYGTGTVSETSKVVEDVMTAAAFARAEVAYAMQKAWRSGHKEEVRSITISFADKKDE
jgi:hypothetical protein